MARNKQSKAARDQAYNAARRRIWTDYVRSLKTEPCADCRGAFHPAAMDFDHVRGAKRFHISHATGRSRKALDAEIAKCDLVCSNCHRVRTFLRRHAPDWL